MRKSLSILVFWVLATSIALSAHAQPQALYSGKTLEQWLDVFLEAERYGRADEMNSVLAALDDAVPELANALSSPERNVQRAAGMVLARFGPKAAPAIPELMLAVKDQGPGANQAADALIAIGPKAVPVLLELLRQPTAAHRAETALVRVGEPAIPGLLFLLSDRNESTRVHAASALARIGAPAVPEVLLRLNNDDPQMREESARVLLRMGGSAKSAAPMLMKHAMTDPVAEVRIMSIRALEAMPLGAPEGLKAIIAATGDKDFEVRKNAVNALGAFGKPAVPKLIETLDSSEAKLRADAAAELGALGPIAAEAAPDLIELLSDDNKSVRYWAVVALGAMGDRSAIGPLEGLRDEPEKEVREEVIRAIGRLEGE